MHGYNSIIDAKAGRRGETHPRAALLLAVELIRGLFADVEAVLVALSETMHGMSLEEQNLHGFSPEHLVFLA